MSFWTVGDRGPRNIRRMFWGSRGRRSLQFLYSRGQVGVTVAMGVRAGRRGADPYGWIVSVTLGG